MQIIFSIYKSSTFHYITKCLNFIFVVFYQTLRKACKLLPRIEAQKNSFRSKLSQQKNCDSNNVNTTLIEINYGFQIC